MKHLSIWLIVLAAVLMGSCTSSGIAGLAKESYVMELETQQAAMEAEMAQIRASLDEDTEIYRQVLADIQDLQEKSEEYAQVTEETRNRLNALEQELQSLPEQTLRELVLILADYLDMTIAHAEPIPSIPEDEPDKDEDDPSGAMGSAQ